MKKVLSLVLSLCLFVSLGAGISFTANAAAADLYYDFTVGGAAYPGKVDYELIGTMTYDKVNELDTSNKSDDWAFHSTAVPSGDKVGGSGNDYITYIAKNGPIVINSYSRKEDYKLRIQFKVPNAGKYVPFVNFAAYSSGNGHNIPYTIYAVNGDGTLGSAISDTKWIHSNSAHTDNHYMAVTETALDLAAGTYAIEFGTVQTKSQVRVKGLKLAAADNATPTVLNLGKGENYFEVNVGEKIQIPLSGKLSNGANIAMATSAGWTMTPDTENVHMYINKANGTLDITGLAETAKETKEIKLGNAMVRFNVKVNAAGYLAPDKNLVYDFTSAMASDAQCNGGNTLLYGSSATNYALSLGADKAYGGAKSNKTSEPWKITGKRDKSGNAKPNLYFNAFMATNIGLYFYDAGSADVQFLVANDGYYVPSVTFYSTAPAADVTIAVKKMDGTVLATKTFAKGANGGATVNITDEAIQMPAGEYMLTFTKATASAMVYTNAFTLTYKNGFTYNVSLDAGEGTANGDVTSYTHGTAVALPTATKEGYTFDGWAEANGRVVTSIAALERGDKAYTAKYTKIPETFAVTLNANGGTVAADLTSYTEGVGATLPAATKAGYTFGGWYDNAECIGTAVTAIDASATGAKEFWAKWEIAAAASDFTVTSDSGYYAHYVTNQTREGVIAVTAVFSNSSVMNAIEKVGIMVYTAGNEANEAKIARVEVAGADLADLAESNGTATALFDGIAKKNFGKEVLAKAYVVIDGQYIYSDVHVADVSYAKWVGKK